MSARTRHRRAGRAIVPLALVAGIAAMTAPLSTHTTATAADYIDIQDVPIAVGDPEPGAIGDESTHTQGNGHYLPYPGSERGYWAGAFSNPRAVPSDQFSALWWCMTVGPWQALEFDDVYRANAPELAYILTMKEPIDTADSRAAIADIVHAQYDTGSDVRDKNVSRQTWGEATRTHLPSVGTLSDAYTAEAVANAGPYTADGLAVELVTNPSGKPALTPEGERQWRIGGIGVQSARGNYVAGHQVTLSVTGPLRFADDSTSTTFDTSTNADEIVVKGTGNGSGTITLTSSQTLPATSVSIGSQPGHQTMVARDPQLEQVSATATFDVALDFQPVATSRVPEAVSDTGTVSDTLTVAPAVEEVWLQREGTPVPVTFEGTAYGTGIALPEQSQDAPADARVLGTRTVVATGPGEYGPVSIEGVDPQFVTWVWEVKEEHQDPAYAEFIRSGWKDGYGLSAETVSVRYAIEIDSSLVPHDTQSGTYLVDDQWSTGYPGDHPEFAGSEDGTFLPDAMTLDNELYFIPGPDRPGPDSCTADRLVASTPSEAKNGFLEVSDPVFKVDEDRGSGTWVVVHAFAGDDRVKPYRSACDDAAQSYFLPDREITVTTRINSSTGPEPTAGDGGSLSDTHLITGEILPGDTGSSELYYVPTGQELVCTPETRVWGTEVLDYTKAEHQGDADYTITSSGFEYGDEGGTYGFVETATDENGNVIARGPCGAPTETIVVGERVQPSKTMPRTGAEVGIVLGAGGALLLLGTATVLIVRHRRSHAEG